MENFISSSLIENRVARPRADEISTPLDVIAALSPHERKTYSYSKAIRALAGEKVDAGLEFDISNAIAKRLKRQTGGFFAPTTLRSGLDTMTSGAGGALVATEVRDLIELLRNKLVLTRMGAKVLSGLTDTVALPVQTTGSTFAWVAENPGEDVSESDASFDQRVMSPKLGQATTFFSRKLLAQASLDVELLVRDDLAKAHANAIELACIQGTGLTSQPLGIINTTGISVVSCGADGAVPTYANLVDLETAIANANADSDGVRFLTTPSMRGKLKQVVISQYGAQMVWMVEGGRDYCMGYEGFVSNNVPKTLIKGSSGAVCHAVIMGSFDQLYIGEWGVLELLVDPYALKKRGGIEVSSWQAVDFLVRQPAAFAVLLDAKLS